MIFFFTLNALKGSFSYLWWWLERAGELFPLSPCLGRGCSCWERQGKGWSCSSVWGLNHLQLLQVTHLQIEPGPASSLHCWAHLMEPGCDSHRDGVVPRLELLSWHMGWVWCWVSGMVTAFPSCAWAGTAHLHPMLQQTQLCEVQGKPQLCKALAHIGQGELGRGLLGAAERDKHRELLPSHPNLWYKPYFIAERAWFAPQGSPCQGWICLPAVSQTFPGSSGKRWESNCGSAFGLSCWYPEPALCFCLTNGTD